MSEEKHKIIVFSQEYAKVLKLAWQKDNTITSEEAASILYCDGKSIPNNQRSRFIRNAIMTLTRMQNDGLVTNITKNERNRTRRFRVLTKLQLRNQISKELSELFGDNFLA